MKLKGTCLLAAFLLGAVSVLGFAPFFLFPLPILALAALIARWQVATPRAAAWLGFAFGLGFFLAGVSWIYVSLHDFGGMPLLVAGFFTLLFCAWLALFPALAGYLFARLQTHQLWVNVLLVAASWTLGEWIRGWLFTGFPWLALGYSQAPISPLAGYAPVLGVYGVSFLSALIAALLGLSWNKWRAGGQNQAQSQAQNQAQHQARLQAQHQAQKRQIFLVGTALTALLGAGFGLTKVDWTHAIGQPITVSLLQGNIKQEMKWNPDRMRESLDTYMRLAKKAPAQLIVLPETALPIMLDHLPAGYKADMQQQGEVLLGIVSDDAAGRFYNSAVVMNGISSAGEGLKNSSPLSPALPSPPTPMYSKQHLVPFGEFTPPSLAWTLALLHIPMSNFYKGAEVQPPFSIAGQKVAVNICFEDVFGEEIIRPLPEATLLVNLTNTAWFGDSLAQPQHLQIAQMRALETGRTMLRATNTGMTAIINPKGKVERVLPAFTEAALTGTAQGFSGATPYSRWGNAAILLLVALCFCLRLILTRTASLTSPLTPR